MHQTGKICNTNFSEIEVGWLVVDLTANWLLPECELTSIKFPFIQDVRFINSCRAPTLKEFYSKR